MDKRLRERRKKVARDRGHKRLYLVLTLVLLALMAGGYLWLRSSQVFVVRNVTVSATDHITADELKQGLGDVLGKNLLRLSTGALEEALAAIPYVRVARVYRRFPDTLDVRVEEYQAVARVEAADGSRWLVASDGRILQKAAADQITLPVLVPAGGMDLVPGRKIQQAQVLAALPLASLLAGSSTWQETYPLDRVRLESDGRVVVLLADKVEVRLGEDENLDQKLKVASTILDQYMREKKKLQYVDVSVVTRAVAKEKTP